MTRNREIGMLQVTLISCECHVEFRVVHFASEPFKTQSHSQSQLRGGTVHICILIYNMENSLPACILLPVIIKFNSKSVSRTTHIQISRQPTASAHNRSLKRCVLDKISWRGAKNSSHIKSSFAGSFLGECRFYYDSLL